MLQQKRRESCNLKTFVMNLLMYLASENQDTNVVIVVTANVVIAVVTAVVIAVVKVNEVTARD